MQNLATNVVDLCGVNQATFLALVNDGRVLVWDAEQYHEVLESFRFLDLRRGLRHTAGHQLLCCLCHQQRRCNTCLGVQWQCGGKIFSGCYLSGSLISMSVTLSFYQQIINEFSLIFYMQ